MSNTILQVFGLWGLAGGATDDWYITQNIDYSYTFELPERDGDGDHGFLLPAKNIIKVRVLYVTGHHNIVMYRLGDRWSRDSLPWQRGYDEYRSKQLMFECSEDRMRYKQGVYKAIFIYLVN